MSKQSNLAYDLSRYEYQAPKPKNIIKAKRVVQVSASFPKTFALVICAGFLMCCVLYGKVETAKLQSEIAQQEDTVDMLKSENVRMQSEIEGKTSLSNIEDYAENVLGLQKLDKSQIEYVELETGNVIEIPETSSNVFVIIKNKFYDILEYLRG